MSANYIWSDDSLVKFQSALSSIEIQKLICDFENENILESPDSINSAALKFGNILLNSAEKSLKRPKVRSHKKRKPQNKWFDGDLKKLRHNLISYGKIYSQFPNDPNVRNHYYKLNREYTKLRKARKRQYKNSIIHELENLHENNPKQYWKLINDLKNNNNEDVQNNITSSEWLNHFKDLNSVNPIFNDRLKDLEDKLKKAEKANCFNELDFHITDAEISSAINKWADGYIKTLHKNSNIDDPNNYRGITITSSVGKLFNSILNSRLDNFLEKYNIIDNCQIGFTKKARASDHMFILKCIIDRYCHNKDGRVFACFVDLRKAFDTVIHTGINLKLLDIGVGTKFYNIIKHMYATSKSCVKLTKNTHTDFFSKQSRGNAR